MVLKEAYEYQNYLSELISSAEQMFLNDDFVTCRKEIHKINAANPDASDKEIEVVGDENIKVTPNQVIDFIVSAIKEKETLSESISEAKRNCGVDIDNFIATNRVCQAFVVYLKILDKHKDKQFTSEGTGYRFNAEGNQVKYVYDIDNVETINFNRNDVRSLIKKYRDECNKRSLAVDRAEITTEVNFTPKWDINNTLEEILEQG